MSENHDRHIITHSGRRRQIFDRLRHKFVALTPEEFVRQSFVDFLIEQRGFPQGLMANEISITLNATTRRCDTVLYNRDRTPLLIVEYKAPGIAVTQTVFDQIARYNLVVGARYLIVTNGRDHYCCRLNPGDSTAYTFLRDIPHYRDLSESL